MLQDSEDEDILYLYDKTRRCSLCSLSPLPSYLQHLCNGTPFSKQKVVIMLPVLSVYYGHSLDVIGCYLDYIEKTAYSLSNVV